MSLQLMSDDRHNHLIKCAESVIGLMNMGIDPNAALLKIAKDSELNSNEVMRVSHAINNSKTLSVLVNETTENKDKPFAITNAELVNQRLYDADPVSDAAESKDEKDAEKNEKTDAMEPKLAAYGLDQPKTNGPTVSPKKKRKAAVSSNQDKNTYLESEPEDHAGAFRNAIGIDPVKHDTTKVAVVIGENHQVQLEITGSGRVVGNPFHKLSAVKHLADEASLEYNRAFDQASDGLCKLSDEFRRTDSPKFDRIEKLAAHSGASEAIVALLFEAGSLDRLGHKRATDEKLAGLVDVTQREQNLVDAILRVDSAWKKAGEKLAECELLREGYARAEETLKTAASIGMGNLTAGMGALSEDVANLPDRLTGKGTDAETPIDLFGGAAGSTVNPENKPEPLTEETALPSDVRQQLTNVGARGNIESLLSDPYIREHPVQDVVDAYNKVKSVNPNLSHAELSALMRQSLASEGTLPFDTLARARE